MTPDEPDFEAIESVDDGADSPWPEPVVELVECWRCGKVAEQDARCPRCGASARPQSIDERKALRKRPKADDSGLIATRLLSIYIGLLFTSVVYGWFLHFGLDAHAINGPEAANLQLQRMIVLEVIDIALIVAALFWVPRPPSSPPISMGRRIGAWAAGPLMLCLALAVNLAYHRLLLDWLGLPEVEDQLFAKCGLSLPLLFAVCIQPAIFEELFFRHLALGSLRAATGVHGAVLASSIMFGVCHIGVPLSIPVLTFVGLVLGYARVLSGGLALPIVLHFAHNLAIVLYSTR